MHMNYLSIVIYTLSMYEFNLNLDDLYVTKIILRTTFNEICIPCSIKGYEGFIVVMMIPLIYTKSFKL